MVYAHLYRERNGKRKVQGSFGAKTDGMKQEIVCKITAWLGVFTQINTVEVGDENLS